MDGGRLGQIIPIQISYRSSSEKLLLLFSCLTCPELLLSFIYFFLQIAFEDATACRPRSAGRLEHKHTRLNLERNCRNLKSVQPLCSTSTELPSKLEEALPRARGSDWLRAAGEFPVRL